MPGPTGAAPANRGAPPATGVVFTSGTLNAQRCEPRLERRQFHIAGPVLTRRRLTQRPRVFDALLLAAALQRAVCRV